MPDTFPVTMQRMDRSRRTRQNPIGKSFPGMAAWSRRYRRTLSWLSVRKASDLVTRSPRAVRPAFTALGHPPRTVRQTKR